MIPLPSVNSNYDISKDSGILVTGKSAQPWSVMSDAEAVLQKTIGKSRNIEERALDEAKSAVEKSKERGYSKGYEEGFSKGCEEALNTESEKTDPLISAFKDLEKKVSDCYTESQFQDASFLEDAFALAKKIVYTELFKNNEAYLNLYKKAAIHVNSVNTATLKVGPRGFEAAQALRSEFEEAIDGLKNLEIVKAGSDDGFLLLETPLGNVNASIEGQLKRAKKIIAPQN